jgi:hypothetical protein
MSGARLLLRYTSFMAWRENNPAVNFFYPGVVKHVHIRAINRQRQGGGGGSEKAIFKNKDQRNTVDKQ